MLNKMSVGTKVAAGFAMLLLILAISSGVSYYSVSQMASISATAERTSKNAFLAAQMEDALDRRISGIRGYLLTGKDKELASYQKAKQDFSDSAEELRPQVKSDEGKQLLAKVDQASQEYAAATDHVAELRTANHTQEATDLYFSPAVAQLRSALHDAIAEQTSHEEKKHAGRRRSCRR